MPVNNKKIIKPAIRNLDLILKTSKCSPYIHFIYFSYLRCNLFTNNLHFIIIQTLDY